MEKSEARSALDLITEFVRERTIIEQAAKMGQTPDETRLDAIAADYSAVTRSLKPSAAPGHGGSHARRSS